MFQPSELSGAPFVEESQRLRGLGAAPRRAPEFDGAHAGGADGHARQYRLRGGDPARK